MSLAKEASRAAAERAKRTAGIDERFFGAKSTRTGFKVGKAVPHEVAKAPGVLQTREGPVSFAAGHHIMTDPQGGKYPVAPEKFKELYESGAGATATPKKILKKVRRATSSGELKTSWGNLQYRAGKDMIVRHGPGDYGVVKPDAFKATYGIQSKRPKLIGTVKKSLAEKAREQ